MRRALIGLVLLVLLTVPANAALSLVGGKPVTTQGTSVYYTVATVAGALNGTTPVEVTIKLPAPTISGSAIILVTGDIEDAGITATLRESRFSAAEADLASESDTVPANGRAAIVVELFENVTKDARMSLPAGTYTFRLVSDDVTSAGTVSATLLFVHTP